MTEDENKIKVFASDDNLKSLGELLSNETSRKIIMNLMHREMYTNEIATKLDIRVSLVIHHLRKLEELGLVEIENKKIKRKGEKHRFFKMNSDIFITLDKDKEDIKKKGILMKIFREGIKFAVIGIAVISTWLSMRTKEQSSEIKSSLKTSSDIVNKTSDIPQPDISPSFHSFVVDPIISISVIIICCSLLLIWVFKKYK